MSQELVEAPQKSSALGQMADRLSISQQNLVNTLKATVFKKANDEQFAALIIVANEYKLNPLTKEIYAFPGKQGEVVPIVSIDGWLRIINSHPQFDGMDEEFADDGSWCKVTIYRKDRTRPTVHTEFLEECRRNTDPWKQHTRRMLKWKTIIQGGRVAFGFGGIYDEDEGRDVAGMRDVTPREEPQGNPFKKQEPAKLPTRPKPEPESTAPPKEEAPKEEPAQDGESFRRAYFESVKTQESKPDIQKPWKLWRLKATWADGPEFEAVTFSDTIGGELEWLEDGEEFLAEVEEGKKGLTLLGIKRMGGEG